MAQLMPLPLTVSCFDKIQIGFAFLVPAHSDSPGKRAVKRVCVCEAGFVDTLLTLLRYFPLYCNTLSLLNICFGCVSLEYKVLTTTEPSFVQPPHGTRSSSVFTLACQPTSSSLCITDIPSSLFHLGTVMCCEKMTMTG